MSGPGQAPAPGLSPGGHGFPDGDSPVMVRAARRRRVFTMAGSAAAHAVLLAALLLGHKDPPALVEPPAIDVELVSLPPPAPPQAPAQEPPSPEPAKPAPPAKAEVKKPVKTPPRRLIARRPKAPVPPDVETVASGDGPETDDSQVSDAELASAAGAGSGGGGGGAGSGGGGSCDMVARLQAALRSDPHVHAAMAGAAASGRSTIRVWRGDWIRSQGQDGAGLAAVREAIMWEVGFAPKACRALPVRGLIVISLADGPGGARVVMGQEHWRWSDLLGLGGASRNR